MEAVMIGKMVQAKGIYELWRNPLKSQNLSLLQLDNFIVHNIPVDIKFYCYLKFP